VNEENNRQQVIRALGPMGYSKANLFSMQHPVALRQVSQLRCATKFGCFSEARV
jgi:hypothetical protein